MKSKEHKHVRERGAPTKQTEKAYLQRDLPPEANICKHFKEEQSVVSKRVRMLTRISLGRAVGVALRDWEYRQIF